MWGRVRPDARKGAGGRAAAGRLNLNQTKAKSNLNLNLNQVQEKEEADALQQEGFSNWTKKDFSVFKSACERHGRKAYESIAQELENKDVGEVKSYSAKFWELGPR